MLWRWLAGAAQASRRRQLQVIAGVGFILPTLAQSQGATRLKITQYELDH
jgi:hypothetical protein